MALEWFHREDGHGGSWLYIVQEQQQGGGESLVLEQDTSAINAFTSKDEGGRQTQNMQTKRVNNNKSTLRVIYCEFNSFKGAVTSI